MQPVRNPNISPVICINEQQRSISKPVENNNTAGDLQDKQLYQAYQLCLSTLHRSDIEAKIYFRLITLKVWDSCTPYKLTLL